MSPKRKRLALCLVVATTAIVLVTVSFSSPVPDPLYEGKKLSEWMDALAAQKPSRFDEAVRALGTNALPCVVRNLAWNDSRLRQKYGDLRAKLPQTIQNLLPKPKPLLQRVHGANTFHYIGTNSLPAAIALLRHPSSTVRESAAWGISSLRRQSMVADQAIPALTAALDDEEFGVRFQAVSAFQEIGAAGSNAVPAITKILVSTAQSDSYTGAAAARALGKIGPPAESALPALKAALLSPNSYLRGHAAVAIWRVSGDVETALPVLLLEIPNESEHSKWDWIIALGEMGPQAKAAVPQLKRELANDKEPWVLNYVTNALRKIDPQGFEKPPK
ncbi:MAG TPA: HEAT repeat domain-containing protein [Verrucomicrobiae bacterium]|nr:HEAT repeat domain-containing protein [Verrucomicrobiae bacterium]